MTTQPPNLKEISGPEPTLDDIADVVLRWRGNPGNWRFYYRSARDGYLGRFWAIDEELSRVNEPYRVSEHWRMEHRVATLFFTLDSALECSVFALNALGWAMHPEGFRDVGTGLGAVRPWDPKREEGYVHVFPQVRATFLECWDDLLQVVIDNHVVSKHRHAAPRAGDPPDDPAPEGLVRFNFRVPVEPKAHVDDRSRDLSGWPFLDPLVADFKAFLVGAGEAAVADAAAFMEGMT